MTGRKQIEDVAAQLRRDYGYPSRIFFAQRVQIAETASIFAKFFGIEHRADARISPMNLGVLEGLSRAEAAERYPAAAQSLEQWRKYGVGIERLSIPGVEVFTSFKKRTASFLLDRVLHRDDEAPYTISVVSNSTIIMLVNLAERGPHALPAHYKNVIMDNASYARYDAATVGASLRVLEVGSPRPKDAVPRR